MNRQQKWMGLRIHMKGRARLAICAVFLVLVGCSLPSDSPVQPTDFTPASGADSIPPTQPTHLPATIASSDVDLEQGFEVVKYGEKENEASPSDSSNSPLQPEANREDARVHNRNGETFFEAEKWELAVDEFSEAIRLDPEYIDAYLRRGAAFQMMANYQEAIDDFSTVLKIDDDHVEALTLRGAAYVIIGESDKAVKDLDLAISNLEPDSRQEPESAELFLNRGLAYFYKEAYAQAVSDLEIAVQLDPTSCSAQAILGNAYDNNGQYSEAMISYAKALALAEKPSEEALIFYDRGQAYANHGDVEKAINELQQALEIGLSSDVVEEEALDLLRRLVPEHTEDLYFRGIQYRDYGQEELALEAFNEIIRLDPEYPYVYNERGLTYLRLGKLDLAIQDFDQAIAQDPLDTFAWNNRGLAYYDKGEYEKALEDFDKAIEIDPEYSSPYFHRGIIYGEQGEFEQSIVEFDRVIEIDPSDSIAYYMRAVSYASLGHAEAVASAFGDLNNAIEIDREYAAAYYFRGYLYEAIGRPELAIADLEKVLELDPEPSLRAKAEQKINSLQEKT